MVGEIIHLGVHLARRGGLVAAVSLAFAIGAGVGAYIATARHLPDQQLIAVVTAGVEGGPSNIVSNTLAVPEDSEGSGGSGDSLGYDAERIQPSEGVHEVARLLSIEVRPTGGVMSATRSAAALLATPVPVYQPPPALSPGDRVVADVTFYYCSGGGAGDGGGFCGRTADGTPVQLGVAACSRAYMGQIFRVVGDPSGLIFRCADTGGAVFGQHRDIWFPTAYYGGQWLAQVGHQVIVEILE